MASRRFLGQVAAAEVQGFEANAEHYLYIKASRKHSKAYEINKEQQFRVN